MKIFDKVFRRKNNQARLMVLPALFLLVYSIVLTLAPTVRNRSWIADLQWGHWIGYFVWLIGFTILFNQITHSINDSDTLFIPIVSVLSGLGILTIWRLNPDLGQKQTLWLFISLTTITLALRIPNILGFMRRYKYLWMFLGLIITSLTFVFGVNPISNGPRLWLQFSNFYFQPSEPLKLLLIIFLAAYFSDRGKFHGNFFRIILPTLVMGVLTIGILISQRDIGTASIFILVYLTLLIMATQKKRLFLLIPIVLILAGVLGYFFLDIVKLRINTWIDPWSTSTTTSYQIVQALIAIASGGIGGTGPGLGSPGLIPVVESDFIFSAIAEELGLLGTTAVIILLLVLMLRSINLAVKSKSIFHRYLSLGLSSYFAIQSILIIGGNLGLLPLTGVTLPFISYGGSSLFTNFLCLLILLIISGEEKQISPPIIITKPINYLGKIFSILFLITILANSWTAIIKRTEIVDKSENPRWIIYDRYIPRGNIYSQNGNLIASTQGQSGSYSRKLDYEPLSTVIGYTNPLYGQSNLEESLYPYLRGLEGVPFADIWWNQKLYNQPPSGLNLRLSLNLTQQRIVDSLIAGMKGSTVLMNAKTGEIYVMASHPYYNPETLEQDWQNLIQDDNAPLLNRATQGAYPLGTATSSLLLPAYLDSPTADLSDLELSQRIDFSCLSITRGADSNVKGLQFGCKRSIQELESSIISKSLIDTLEAFGLYSAPSIQLSVLDPSEIPSQILNPTAYFSSADDLLVSPLQMALTSSVLTNWGILPCPRIVNSYQDKYNNWIAFPALCEPKEVLNSIITNQVINLLQAGSEPFWFTMGFASTKSGETVTWYLGGTLPEWQGTPLAVAIVLEEYEPILAQEIGRLLLTQATEY